MLSNSQHLNDGISDLPSTSSTPGATSGTLRMGQSNGLLKAGAAIPQPLPVPIMFGSPVIRPPGVTCPTPGVYGPSPMPDIPDDTVGLHPWVIDMLVAIKNDTAKAFENVSDLENRVAILEDQADNDGGAISQLQAQMNGVLESNKTLFGRLVRTESRLERQKAEIVDLKSRSMRDNLIIKSKGNTYKETLNENTADKFRQFAKNELRVADAERISITRAHRMGSAYGDNNRMMIAKVSYDADQRRLFNNASALKNTGFSISKQVPPEIEERRQFGWPDYKRAKDEGQNARFDPAGHLVIGDSLMSKIDPVPLPTTSL